MNIKKVLLEDAAENAFQNGDFHLANAFYDEIGKISAEDDEIEKKLESKHFTHPDTGNKVVFKSLPEDMQHKIRESMKAKAEKAPAGKKVVKKVEKKVVKKPAEDDKTTGPKSKEDMEGEIGVIKDHLLDNANERLSELEGEGDGEEATTLKKEIEGYESDIATYEKAISESGKIDFGTMGHQDIAATHESFENVSADDLQKIKDLHKTDPAGAMKHYLESSKQPVSVILEFARDIGGESDKDADDAAVLEQFWNQQVAPELDNIKK